MYCPHKPNKNQIDSISITNSPFLSKNRRKSVKLLNLEIKLFIRFDYFFLYILFDDDDCQTEPAIGDLIN